MFKHILPGVNWRRFTTRPVMRIDNHHQHQATLICESAAMTATAISISIVEFQCPRVAVNRVSFLPSGYRTSGCNQMRGICERH
jgi:hypothetical protein